MTDTTGASALWRPWTPITQQAQALRIVESVGSRVRDSDGKWYVDAISGVLNASCGHAHPRIIEAATQQMGRVVHYDPMVTSHDPAERLAHRLADLLPGELNESVLLNSGSEATEAAIRIALQYWRNIGEDRNRVIAFEAGYHGSTFLCQKLSGLPFTVSEWTEPFPIDRVPLPADARGMRTEASLEALVHGFEQALQDGPPAAAVIVEPLLGLGGCVMLPKGFLARLRTLCDEHGTLLVLDEIFTGFGRTGRMFGFEHEDITPDIVLMSKGISGGYVPLSALTVTTPIKQSFLAEPLLQGLRYGHTTGGHAVAAAVANTVLDVMADEGLVDNAATQGRRLLDGLGAFLDSPLVADVRGIGLVVALEATSEEVGAMIAATMADEGVMARHERGVIRIAPPLCISTDETQQIIDAVGSALSRDADPAQLVG